MLRVAVKGVRGGGCNRPLRFVWGAARPLSNAQEGLLLPGRSLLAVEGKDKDSFLQGMVTNDVTKLRAAGGVETALFTHFLNAKGRYRFDAFVASLTADSPLAVALKESGSVTEDNGFLIDTSADQVEGLAKYLKMRTLGSKVKVRQVPSDSLVVKQYLPQGSASVQIEEGDLDGPSLLFKDPRTERMGMRAIERAPSGGGDEAAGEEEALHRYRLRRLLCGIAEGPSELEAEKTVPLEASLHYFNAVCFTKGCYVGQELMARVHFTGTLRKQAIALLLPDASASSETQWTSFERAVAGGGAMGQGVKAGDTVTFVKAGDDKGRRVGKVMAVEGRAALVMMRFLCLEESAAEREPTAEERQQGPIGGTLCIAGECGDTIAASHVVRPHWWAERPVER